MKVLNREIIAEQRWDTIFSPRYMYTYAIALFIGVDDLLPRNCTSPAIVGARSARLEINRSPTPTIRPRLID